MRTFTLDKDYTVTCQFKNTRSGFKHTAVLWQNGTIVDETKVCYLNRTWESFEYEEVLCKIVRKFFTKEEDQQKYLKIINTLG